MVSVASPQVLHIASIVIPLWISYSLVGKMISSPQKMLDLPLNFDPPDPHLHSPFLFLTVVTLWLLPRLSPLFRKPFISKIDRVVDIFCIFPNQFLFYPHQIYLHLENCLNFPLDKHFVDQLLILTFSIILHQLRSPPYLTIIWFSW